MSSTAKLELERLGLKRVPFKPYVPKCRCCGSRQDAGYVSVPVSRDPDGPDVAIPLCLDCNESDCTPWDYDHDGCQKSIVCIVCGAYTFGKPGRYDVHMERWDCCDSRTCRCRPVPLQCACEEGR